MFVCSGTLNTYKRSKGEAYSAACKRYGPGQKGKVDRQDYLGSQLSHVIYTYRSIYD